MRKLFALVFLAAFAWGGYWFIGSHWVEKGLKDWLAQRAQAGWVADYASLDTVGFPSRFDTTITDLTLADPASGIAWSVPRLDILMLSYKPNHIIAMLPGEQTAATPYQTVTIASDAMRGSVVFAPDTDLALDRSTFEIENMVLSSTLGWQARVDHGQLATRRPDPDDPLTQELSYQAVGFTPADSVRRRIDPAGVMPETFSAFSADVTARFTAPWDRHAIEGPRPQVTHLDVELITAKWGELELKLAGSLDVDDAGVPTGEITVKASNWRDMLQLGVASGALPEGALPMLTSALEFVAGVSGDPNVLDAPVTFKNGRMAFGPIPMGPAPRLVIR